MLNFESEFHKRVVVEIVTPEANGLPGLYEAIGSKNRTTRIFKDPRTATGTEVLIFAEATGLPPALLIDEYELGLDGMHPVELRYYTQQVSAA